MSFINGSISFSRFRTNLVVDQKIFVKNLNAFKARDTFTQDKDECIGWACVHNFLITDFTVENVCFGPFLLFSLRKSQKKVPSNLLKAYCQQAELKELQDSGKERLTRFEKSEIKSEIKQRLLKQQPIEYASLDCFLDTRTGVVYYSGTSKKKIEEFVNIYETTFQANLELLDSYQLAETFLNKKDFKDLNQKTSAWFGVGKKPDSEINLEDFLGPDFLTWLWFTIEKESNEFEIDGVNVGIILTDYLMLSSTAFRSNQSEKNIYDKGMPTLCSEAGTSLRVGKKLYEAKFLAAIGEKEWEGKLDIQKFIIRGLKLPALELDDEDDALTERIESLVELTNFFDAIFMTFLHELLSDNWDNKIKLIRKWVKEKGLQEE